MLCGRFLLLISPLTSVTKPFSINNLSLFCLLHVQWASWRLFISEGWPPFAMGIIWSMHFANGCGYLSVMSTGLPHIPHTVWVAYILFLLRSNWRRWVPFSSGLLLFLAIISFFVELSAIAAALFNSELCPPCIWVTKNPRTVGGFFALCWSNAARCRPYLTITYYHTFGCLFLSILFKGFQLLNSRLALRCS